MPLKLLLLRLTLPGWSPDLRKLELRSRCHLPSCGAHGNARFFSRDYCAAARIRVSLQTLQFRPHIRGVLVAQVAVFFQRSVDDAFQFGGRSGFRRTGAVGARCKIAWKIRADVSPRKGIVPVDIS